jgi:hypothetical protein
MLYRKFTAHRFYYNQGYGPKGFHFVKKLLRWIILNHLQWVLLKLVFLILIAGSLSFVSKQTYQNGFSKKEVAVFPKVNNGEGKLHCNDFISSLRGRLPKELFG